MALNPYATHRELPEHLEHYGMEPTLMLSTIELFQKKIHLPSLYTDEKIQLLEPSIDMYLFYQSYSFVDPLSNRNQPTLLSYSRSEASSNSSNHDEG